MPHSATSALLHGAVRPEWIRPPVPNGFDRLVYCEYGFAGELDFYNDALDEFYSADLGYEISIERPWPPSFNATILDWAALGIEVIDFRSAFYPG